MQSRLLSCLEKDLKRLGVVNKGGECHSGASIASERIAA